MWPTRVTTENQKVTHGLPEMASLHVGVLQKRPLVTGGSLLRTQTIPRFTLNMFSPKRSSISFKVQQSDTTFPAPYLIQPPPPRGCPEGRGGHWRGRKKGDKQTALLWPLTFPSSRQAWTGEGEVLIWVKLNFFLLFLLVQVGLIT